MKQILTILLFCFISLYGSSQNKRNKERDIKTTDLYLYGEATADTQDEATNLAKKMLASRIYDFEPGLINNSESLEQAIDKSEHYISMPRGIKFRTIAFMLKTEVQELANDAAMATAEESATTDKPSPAASPEPEQAAAPVPVAAVTPPQEQNPQSGEPAVHRQSLAEIEQETQKRNQAEATADEKHAQTSTDETSEQPQIRSSFSSGEDLLQYILTIEDARILQKLFDEQKGKGMMIYGGKSTLSFPDKCYLVVYSRNGVVKAYLDKGRVSRKNLLTDTMESLNNYGNEPFIWFQLMN
ncbi:hypothetical protein [Mangrovibacterium marinum]|nr:hypothetical protein [Mangrovibacterium marinum]